MSEKIDYHYQSYNEYEIITFDGGQDHLGWWWQISETPHGSTYTEPYGPFDCEKDATASAKNHIDQQ